MKSHRIRFRIILSLAASLLLIAPNMTSAAIFGQVSTARTLDKSTFDVGGFISVFEDATLLFAQYRRGMANNFDFGVQGGIVDPEFGDLGLAFGGDAKFLVMRTGNDAPFDLALNPRFSFLSIDRATVIAAGGSVVISRDYAVENGSLSPYGALNVRIESISFDDNLGHYENLAAKAQSHIEGDSEFEISGIAGVKWDVSDLIDILGEVVFDEDIGFTIGLNFKL